MKLMNIKYAAVACIMAMGTASCEDFLNRPVEDNYNIDNFYSSDESCISGVNYLYNSPWYDFQRGFIKIGEVMSGNMFWGSSPYLNFSVNGTDQDLVNMSYSLWAEIGHSSTVYDAIKKATCSEAVRNQCMGECLAWRAMAYFFLVRTFGDVPIIHNTSEVLASGEYRTCMKVQKADVYEYIAMTLEKAMELLPKTKSTTGRIDYYCAEGLLAKVYLAKAGVNGSLDNADLEKAAAYAKDVIDNSGRELMPEYEDIFRGSNNVSDESLFAWRWTMGAHWTCQNTLQSDLGIEGFSETGDLWGGWGGPSVDLMDAFGVSPTDNPAQRQDADVRRKATLMLPGDVYSYFWRDKGGFDYLRFIYDKEYNPSATGQLQGPCGTNNVKHLYGNIADHEAEMGITPARMAYALATHILRLSDVYLTLAEAKVLMGKGTDADALDAFNAVHQRAVAGADEVTSLTFADVWKERRLEFAGEGDRWYDYVRRSYYDADACIAELKAQRRAEFWGCDELYKAYFESDRNIWTVDPEVQKYNEEATIPNVTAESFILPYPTEDVSLNPNLGSDVAPVHVDVRATYSY